MQMQPPIPDPLVLRDGTRVTDALTWRDNRRAEIRGLFEEQVYGRAPVAPRIAARPAAPDASSRDGTAILRQVALPVPNGPTLHLLIWLPVQRRGPVPVLLGLNFYGNHSTCPDAQVVLPTSWLPDRSPSGSNNRATDAGRGSCAADWPVHVVLERGWGVATIYHGDIDPDRNDFSDGVHPAFYRAGQTAPAADEWGTLAAWAWGLRRGMDYLITDPDIDTNRIVVFGHSRNGKAALWAGALDERFAAIISNQSGCGGAALFRGKVGERITAINAAFPHWFCGNFKRYNDREADLPIDQHLLIALAAPRPVLVLSAADDTWADPRAELGGLCGADPVYRLLGTPGIGPDLSSDGDMPLNTLCGATLAHHLRPGGHGIGEADWRVMLEFVTTRLMDRDQ